MRCKLVVVELVVEQSRAVSTEDWLSSLKETDALLSNVWRIKCLFKRI